MCGLLLCVSAAHVMAQPVAEIEGAAERVVENFRRLIALHDGAARTRTPAAALAGREGRGIILFHDIHGRSVQALPLAIEGLLKRGFRFARWEAGVLTTEGAPLAAK